MLTIQGAKPTTPLCTIEHVTLNSNSRLTRRNYMLHTPVCLDIGFMLQMINAARIPADVLLNGEVVLDKNLIWSCCTLTDALQSLHFNTELYDPKKLCQEAMRAIWTLDFGIFWTILNHPSWISAMWKENMVDLSKLTETFILSCSPALPPTPSAGLTSPDRWNPAKMEL